MVGCTAHKCLLLTAGHKGLTDRELTGRGKEVLMTSISPINMGNNLYDTAQTETASAAAITARQRFMEMPPDGKKVPNEQTITGRSHQRSLRREEFLSGWRNGFQAGG